MRSSLVDRPNTEAEAALQCNFPGATHWDGCPCSLLRLDNEIQALRAELQIARDDRETYRRAWMRGESERDAALTQIAELRAALELALKWASTGGNNGDAADPDEWREFTSDLEKVNAAIARTPAEALERQRRTQAVVDAAREFASRPALPRGMEGRDITKLRDVIAALDDGGNGESDES